MTENEVREAAKKCVSDQQLDPCRIVSVRRFAREEIGRPTTVGDEWVVQLQFEANENMSDHFGMVIVDDATGVAEVRETL